MTWETFSACLDKLPLSTSVSFGGMSEPFQNRLCADMVLAAASRGHTVEVFTTLVGCTLEDIDRLSSTLEFGNGPSDNRLFVHLPSDGMEESIVIDNAYLEILSLMLSECPLAELHFHGSRVHRALADITWNGRLQHWPIHNRAVNETMFYGKAARKNGRIHCVMNLDVNVLMPNGDVFLCCQDFGCTHKLGNLRTDTVESLHAGLEFRRVVAALCDEQQDVICRYCHFAVEHAGPAT